MNLCNKWIVDAFLQDCILPLDHKGNCKGPDKMLTTLEFAKECPAGFAALPESYQADDVLVFFQAPYSNFSSSIVWKCQPRESQKQYVGSWIAAYSSDIWWNEDGEPIE